MNLLSAWAGTSVFSCVQTSVLLVLGPFLRFEIELHCLLSWAPADR